MCHLIAELVRFTSPRSPAITACLLPLSHVLSVFACSQGVEIDDVLHIDCRAGVVVCDLKRPAGYRLCGLHGEVNAFDSLAYARRCSCGS